MAQPFITLESLAQRVETLERALLDQNTASARDWRNVVGMFAGCEFMRQVDEEGRKLREAERDPSRINEEEE